MKALIPAVLAAFAACPAPAQDVLIIGEVHDNPAHHRVQADRIAGFAPAALVVEMLTPEQADGAVLDTGDAAALERRLGWAGRGWPDFALYYPVFAAAPQARVYGAGVPRDRAAQALETGLVRAFGEGAATYGLDRPLPAGQQARREALQMAAHCDALPPDMAPGMVAVQRLRNASLARALMRAMAATGGPVAVITGNGHARRDWGVPAVLARVAPGLEILVIGQTEDGAPLPGGFDLILSSPAAERPDPCAALHARDSRAKG